MRMRGGRTFLGLVAFAVLLLSAGAEPASAEPTTKYSLAGGCYSLRSDATGLLVAKHDDGYSASADRAPGAERFRMQATDLGSYLLYGSEADFLAIGSQQGIVAAHEASRFADWAVQAAGGGTFTLHLASAAGALAVDGEGTLVRATGASSKAERRFSFVAARGCKRFPEVEVNAVGKPLEGESPYSEVSGFVDMHVHPMFFEALGGMIHCGQPWHRYGVTEALPDCAGTLGTDGSATAPVQNFLNWGSPVYPHDTVGWPTFNDWPNHHSLTYEQVYYRWIERAWRGGLRLMTPLAADNAVLCELYPLKKHSCNEMDSIRRQLHDWYQLQDYIDAQEGGPGKGWLKIVRTPFQARRVMNDGRLAIVLGIETSKLFDCGIQNGNPQCDEGDIDRGLDEVYGLGVRQMELINKFDTAFGGVAGDGGLIGPVINLGNFYETGSFLRMGTCEGEAHDNSQDVLRTDIGYGLVALLPPGSVPVYPEGPQCNMFGFTELGEHLVEGMMDRGMLIDPDHLSVLARDGAMDQIEHAGYSGVISSHSWADEVTYPRVYDAGGTLTPYAGSSTGFVEEWRSLRKLQNNHYFFGFGYGSDMNGFGSQGSPRTPSEGNPPVRYPFKSFDGGTTFQRQRSGQRTFDINVDGVAHYGLYPDWIEDLRILGGDKIIEDMSRGAEAYLQTWERAIGIAPERCRTANSRAFESIRPGITPQRVLRTAGQPAERQGSRFEYCLKGKGQRALVVHFSGSGRVDAVG